MKTNAHRTLPWIAGLLSAVFIIVFWPGMALSAPPPASSQEGGAAAASAPAAEQGGSETKEPAKKEKVRLYTNADLDKLEPIPGQKVPLAGPGSQSPGAGELPSDWASINAFIERERAYEQQQRDRQMVREEINRAEKQREQELVNPWYSLPLPVYSYYPGVCSWRGCGGHPGKPGPPDMFDPSWRRNVKTAVDLPREYPFNPAPHSRRH